MNNTDRIMLSLLLTLLAVMLLITSRGVKSSLDGIKATEVRLQNMEHLLSLLASESRPSASLGPTNGLPAFSYEEEKGADIKIKRRAQRKPSNNSSKDDRRTEGQ